MSWIARNGSQRPTLMCPLILSSAARAGAASGAMAWSSHRRAGSGSGAGLLDAGDGGVAQPIRCSHNSTIGSAARPPMATGSAQEGTVAVRAAHPPGSCAAVG